MQPAIAKAQRAFNRNVTSGQYGAGNHARHGPVALLAADSLIMILPVTGLPRTIVEPAAKQALIGQVLNFPNPSPKAGIIAMIRDLTETVESPLLDNISLQVFSYKDFGLLLSIVDDQLHGGAGGPTVLSNYIGATIDLMNVRNIRLELWGRDDNYPSYFHAGVGMLLANLMVRYLLDEDRSAPGSIAEYLMNLRDQTQTGHIMPRVQYGSTAAECIVWLTYFLTADVNNVKHVVPCL